MPDMIEVMIDSIRVHLMAPQRVVVLKQTDAERYLTIWVGPYEAEAINVAVEDIILQFDDLHTRHACIECVEDIFEQVMGKWAHHFNFLQCSIDGSRFVWADPDCEIAFRIRLFEHYNALRRHQVYTNTIDHHFYHILHGNSATAILA